jgi:hypothetical protein
LIRDSSVSSQLSDVSIIAIDGPQVDASAGAGDLAITVGNGVALASGVVLLETNTTNQLSASIENPASKSVQSGGDILLRSESKGDYSSLGVAVAAAASIGEFSLPFAGAGGNSKVDLASRVTASIVSGQVQAQESVQVLTTSSDRIAKNTLGAGGLSIGIFGASIGVSLAESHVSNTVTSTISGGAITATSGDIVVDSRASHEMFSESVPTSLSLAIGGAGAGGHAFSTDESQILATIDENPVLNASRGRLIISTGQVEQDGVPIDAAIRAHAGAGVGGLAAIGAVLVKSTDATIRKAEISGNVDLRGVGSLQILAYAAANVIAQSTAVDVGGVAVDVNKSVATVSGTIEASTGNGVYLPAGDVILLARATTSMDVDQSAYTLGLAAAGATISEAYNQRSVSAQLGANTRSDANRDGRLVVQALQEDKSIKIRTVAGTGGFFAGQGATGLLEDKTKTTVSVVSGAVQAGTVSVGAERNKILEIDVDTATISFAIGIGITTATYDDQSVVDVVLGAKSVANNLQLRALDTMTVTSSNRLRRTEDSIQTSGIGGAGLESIQGVMATAKINSESNIIIEDGVRLESGVHPLTRPGGILILPSLQMDYQTHTSIANVGLLLAGSVVNSQTTGKLASSVVIGNHVVIKSRGDLLVGNDAAISSSNQSAGWGGAIFVAGVELDTEIDLDLDQTVTVGQSSSLSAVRNLTISASQDPRTGQPSLIDFRAHAIASSRSLIAAATAKARSTLDENVSLDIGRWTSLESGGNTLLHAGTSKPVFDVLGESSYYYLFGLIRSSDTDNSYQHNPSSNASLQGSVVAGYQNQLNIEVTQDPSNKINSVVSLNPANLYEIPVSPSIQRIGDFNPVDYIKAQQLSSDVSLALQQGVSSTPVPATRIALGSSDFPIIVSGGSVTVVADHVAADSARIEARVASIKVTNHSSDYLLLGSLQIANVPGGAVQFSDSSGKTLSDPVRANISRDTGIPSIKIESDFGTGVGNSSNGPAVFIAKPLVNLGGLVSIHNARGSFGQFAGIVAKEIDISTPNGVFAVDLPNSGWTVAGSPVAQYQNSSEWPLSYSSVILRDANKAAMVGVNSTYQMDLPNWRTATDDAALNDFVYGKPSDPNRDISWVFFGGSVPQDSKTGDGNSQAKSEAWAQLSRIDGDPKALKLTDKTPPLGKNEGWDHAWVPSLQRVAVEGQRPDLASRNPTRMVQGQVVVIRAKTVNINGTIQAGQPKTTDHSIVLPEELETKLLDYQKDYRLGEIGSPILEIPVQWLQVSKDGDELIGATFDARTGQIQLQSVEGSGAGRVHITGKILNTDLAGKIKMTGGSGDITVLNRTKLPLSLSKIQTQSDTKKGVVSITDLNIEDQTQRQVAYVYTGSEILAYRGAEGADLTSSGVLRDRIVGNTTSYQPRSGLRWNWELSAQVQRDIQFDLKNWSGVTASSWRFVPPASNVMNLQNWTVVGGVDSGELSIDSGKSAMTQSMKSSWDAYVYELGLVVHYSKYSWDTGFVKDRNYRYPNHIDLGMTLSIKADYPIGIDFSGLKFGNVSVDSQGTVLVGGSLVSPSVTLISHDGGIQSMQGNIAIDTSKLKLSASDSIGNAVRPFHISADSIELRSDHGSIFVDANRNLVGQPLGVVEAYASQGQVVISANGSIQALNSKMDSVGIQARQVDLVSRGGGIGSDLQPIELQADSDWGNLRLNTRSTGGVSIRVSKGDLLVGLIDASDQEVRIDAQQDIFSGESWTIDPKRDLARLQSLIGVGATDINAYQDDVRDFASRINNDYILYWELRKSGDVNQGVYQLRDSEVPLWRIRAQAIHPDQVLSHDQVRLETRKLYESLVASFSDKMGPDWLSRPEFQKRQDGYQYVATQQQVDRFKEGRFIEAANISIGLLQRALDIPAVDRGLEDRPSIIANRLRLISQAGNIGKQDATMRIAISELNAGRATPEQLQEMNLATRPGDATLDLDNSTLNLNILRPLVISVSGRVDAFANQNVILKNANGPLIAGNIGANLGKVSLVAEEDLLRARRETLDFSGASVRFDQPQNWRLLGTAGQTLTEYSGLFVPGTRNSVSASWFSDPVVHGSFRASFTYHASTADEGSAGDGLAFVLRSSNADEVGNLGGGLGYSGLGGNKAGFLINLYTPNGQKRGTRFDTTGLVGDYHPSDIALVNNTVYVTLIYDATTNTVTSTLGRSVDDPSPEKQTYTGVDLGKLLGDQYYLGFTTATGGAFCSQSVQDFSLVVSDSSRSQQVSFPDYIDDPKWTINRLSNDASDSTRGFAFSQGPSGSTLVFPEKSGIASSTWFGEKVSINSNFYVRFNYDYSSVSSSPADGLALVFHNSSTGLKALGSDGSDLGYGSIAGPKVGLLLNIYQSSSQNIYQGIRFDSLGKPGNYQPISPLPSSIVVSLSYNFSTKLMIVEVLEGVKLIKQFKYDNVDLPTLLGANTAWMGFTAASGALSAKQTVSSFSFYSPPLPPVGDSEVSCYLNGDVRLLANGVLMALPSLNSSTSTWFKQPIATNDFHAEWTYSATDKYGLDYADGMAFVIQDGTAGVGARGSAGGKLGYGGLKGKKVGLLFNIYKSPGFRFDDGSETGDFLPVPWLTGQDVRVQVRYEAKTSSITVHATSGKPNQDFRKTWQGVNLAKLVGLNGLVGFTTGTGASASRQSIKGFQFNQPVSIWALREQDASGVSIQVRSEKGDIGSLAAPIRLQGKFQALAPHGNIYTDPSVVSSTGYLNATLRTYQVGSNQIWVTTATPGATLELFSGTAHLEQLYNPSGAFVGLDNPRLLATQQVAADGTAVFEFIVGEEGTVPQLLQVIEKASRQRRSPVLYAIPPVLGNNLGTAGSVLNEADLLVLASEAKKRWLGIGLTTIEQNRLSTIRFAMKDLGNGRLTQLVGEVLYVNFNAGGNEWFIDPTPSDDSEFNRLRGKFDLYAYKDRVHSQQTDLLSAIVMGLAPVFLTEPTGFIPDYIEKTGSLENGIRRILGSQRINPTNPYDVNRDGVLNPLDALMVVDWLNRQSGNSAPQASVYLDTNFDNIISPLDVLEVIHELNSYYPESPADGESNWDMLSPTQVDEYWSRLREEEFV